MSITYMHWQNSFYHKTVGGRAAAIISFFAGGVNFFLFFWERFTFFFWKIRVTKYWRSLVTSFTIYSMIKKVWHISQAWLFHFLCWKIMWKYFMSFWLQNNVKISGISIVFIQMDSEGRREDEKSFQSLQNLGNFVITIDVILAWTRLNGK